MSAKELRAELRSLRKDHVKPVSRMPVKDVSAEIEMLKMRRNETPAVAATPSTVSRAMKSTSESIKDAKMGEFPVAPEGSPSTKKAVAKKPKGRKAEYKREFEHKVKVEEAKPSKEEKKMHTKVKREMKKMPSKAEEPKAESKGRPAKGSEEMKERMRKLREMRKKKE